MNENYVTDLLSEHLKKCQAELHEIDEFLHREYNDHTSEMALSKCVAPRRTELRGRISALRQAITILQKEMIPK